MHTPSHTKLKGDLLLELKEVRLAINKEVVILESVQREVIEKNAVLSKSRERNTKLNHKIEDQEKEILQNEKILSGTISFISEQIDKKKKELNEIRHEIEKFKQEREEDKRVLNSKIVEHSRNVLIKKDELFKLEEKINGKSKIKEELEKDICSLEEKSRNAIKIMDGNLAEFEKRKKEMEETEVEFERKKSDIRVLSVRFHNQYKDVISESQKLQTTIQ